VDSERADFSVRVEASSGIYRRLDTNALDARLASIAEEVSGHANAHWVQSIEQKDPTDATTVLPPTFIVKSVSYIEFYDAKFHCNPFSMSLQLSRQLQEIKSVTPISVQK